MKPPIHLENRSQTGARLFSPTAARNREPIANVLMKYLPQEARVLEIASGSGEHGVHMCSLRRDIIWQPSDLDAVSRASQDDWAQESKGQILTALPINTMDADWWSELEKVDAMFCANMIHIAPWEAACGLAKGAKHILKTNRHVIIYGPFLEGDETAQSNLDFNATLQSRNPEWGVRKLSDVKHIFSEQGFNLTARIVMPRENRCLIFGNS